MKISISKGNEKMGSIMSVSLPAVLTCRTCGCNKKCYARRIECRRPSVKAAYHRNMEILMEDPDTYWREVEAAVMLSRFFRFHVSGDIPDAEYFSRMIGVAERNRHCEILCFTKKYEIVNGVIRTLRNINADLPENLHVLISGWTGFQFENPYRLPEAHVHFRDGTTTARPDAKKCGGNCTACAVTGTGCWTLRRGEQIVFDEH